jgi:hypothetical protein
MLQDSATRHLFDTETAAGWLQQDIAAKVYDLDSTWAEGGSRERLATK